MGSISAFAFLFSDGMFFVPDRSTDTEHRKLCFISVLRVTKLELLKLCVFAHCIDLTKFTAVFNRKRKLEVLTLY